MARRAINITSSTIYKNVEDDDVQFNISPGAELILRGYDVFTDDAIIGGLTRVSGVALVIDDSLTIGDDTIFANASTVVQNTGYLYLDETATVRNLAGATWELDDGTAIETGDNFQGQFINSGLLLQPFGTGFVDPTFVDRGGTIQIEGYLEFDNFTQSTTDRFVDDTITGSGELETGDVVFNNSNISVATAQLNGRFLGDVVVSSTTVNAEGNFAPDAVLDLTNSTANVTLGSLLGGEVNIKGNDSVSLSFAVLTGYTTLNNYGSTVFSGTSSVFTNPWVDDTITIENEANSTWTDIGSESSFQQDTAAYGSSIFVNDGIFVENTANGVAFDFNVINDDLMEGGSDLVAGSGKLSGLYFAAGLSGVGVVDVGAANVDVAGSVGSGQTFDFLPVSAASALPTLTITNLLGFSGLVSGFDQNAGDRIELTAAWQLEGFTPNSGGTGGSLMFSNGSVDASIDLSGSFDPTGFHSTTNLGKTIVTYST
jgi:hypothetical protein